MTDETYTYYDAFGREKTVPMQVAGPAPSRHEHFFHTGTDFPPEPEPWVVEGWQKHLAVDGFEKNFRVSDPEWVEREDGISEGYWVIVSEAEA